jgi:HK97 family phage major capsid protein
MVMLELEHHVMSLAQRIGVVSSNIETSTRTGEFAAIARLLMLARGDKMQAAELAEARHLSARVAEVFRKSVVAPTSLTTASALAEYTGTTSAFLESLKTVGAFDRMLPDMKQVPPRARVASVTLNATSFLHNEGDCKPVSSLQFEGHTLEETEVAAIIVQSEELLRALSPESGALIRRELAGAVASVTDRQFIDLITASLTPLVSVGATSNQIMQDISRLLNALDVDQASRVYILAQPNTVKSIATKVSGTTGEFAFPTMGIQGGTLAGVEVIPSDGVGSGEMIAIDANAVAASSSALGLDIFQQGDIQMESAPDSPPTASTTRINLWQHNLSALLLRRRFGCELLRTTGAAMLSGVNYYTSNSPA